MCVRDVCVCVSTCVQVQLCMCLTLGVCNYGQITGGGQHEAVFDGIKHSIIHLNLPRNGHIHTHT